MTSLSSHDLSPDKNKVLVLLLISTSVESSLDSSFAHSLYPIYLEYGSLRFDTMLLGLYTL